MPKVSKGTASSHQVFPGYVDAYAQEVDGWTVSIGSSFTDMDQAPFFEGTPNDQCQASHVGYVLKGKFGVRRAGGVEEIYEAETPSSSSPGTRRWRSQAESLWPSHRPRKPSSRPR